MPVAIDPFRTPKRRLLDDLLTESIGLNVADYVRAQRRQGIGNRRIAKAITELTGVDVGSTSLRTWVKRDR